MHRQRNGTLWTKTKIKNKSEKILHLHRCRFLALFVMSVETISDFSYQHALRFPSSKAFSFVKSDGSIRTWTWSQLELATKRVTSLLTTNGVSLHSHVGISAKNSAAFYVVLLALIRLNAVGVPISSMLNSKTMFALVSNADCVLLIADDDVSGIELFGGKTLNMSAVNRCMDDESFLENADQLVPAAAQPSDLCHIMFSSGTTGTPKGIMLCQRTRFRYGLYYSSTFSVEHSSVVIHSGSLVFNGAFVFLLAALYRGCHFVLLEGFEVNLWVRIAKETKATHAIMVPTLLFSLVRHKDLGALRDTFKCVVRLNF